jgi:hypothetical protein
MSDTQLVYGSLQDVAQREKKSVAHTFLSVDALVMVDTSGSMMMNDCQNNRSRYDLACEQLIRLQRDLPGKIGVISWNSYQNFCAGGVPTSPCGGTDMAGVLKFVKPADNTSIKLILISDGEPDDEDKALKLAGQFRSKIDCIFAGPEGGYGRDFLRRLAEASGGQFKEQNPKSLDQLANTVSRLLLKGA